MMKENEQLLLPGLSIYLKNASHKKNLTPQESGESHSKNVINFYKELRRIEHEEEKRQIDSILDFYKIF